MPLIATPESLFTWKCTISWNYP